jgi:tryptophan 2,3-dioxygenase
MNGDPFLSQSARPASIEVTYGDYLRLDQLLSAQQPRTDPAHHDEQMFIIYHQITELWLKLLLHELDGVRGWLRTDQVQTCLNALGRAQEILLQLVSQWSVMETLTPAAFTNIRPFLGSASGLFSTQYRALEFLLGKRHPGWQEFFRDYPGKQVDMDSFVGQPSLFDEFLCYLHRCGHLIPRHYTNRDWKEPRETTAERLETVFSKICADEVVYRNEYLICEQLSLLDVRLRLWRVRHLQVVEKLIKNKQGTGGTSGIGYLKTTVDQLFFPELSENKPE